MEPIIKTENLTVIYELGKSNETIAINNINLEIYPGEYIICFGPSGCGKSTLLYCLAGLETPTRGEILIEGKSLTHFSQKELVNHRRLKVGMIFQAYNLIPTLKVLDNVLLPIAFGGLISETGIKRATSLLERFGIAELSNRYPTELSGGQQQRVAIARALIYNPPILFADEPVGSLDSISAKIVMDTLRELNEKDGKTIILVTHNPSYLDNAHRVFHMKDGKIVREVINPKRRQIAPPKEKLIPTEAELGKKARPKPFLKPSALVQYLLTSFDEPVIKRLERAIEKRILGEIDDKQFKEMLDRPLEEGGVGLYRQTAESFSQKIEKILSEIEFLKEEGGEQPISAIEIKVQELRRYLLDGSKVTLKNEEEVKRLDHFIRLRLENKIDKKEFQKFLDLPFAEGGVGLDKRTARNFARKLELILEK